MISSRVTTSPALAMRMWSRSNSFAASSTADLFFDTVRAAGSKCDPADLDGTLTRRSASATHDGAHPRDEFTSAEWFDDVVVGPDLQADDPNKSPPPGGQHDDWQVRPFRASPKRSRPSPSGNMTSRSMMSGIAAAGRRWRPRWRRRPPRRTPHALGAPQAVRRSAGSSSTSSTRSFMPGWATPHVRSTARRRSCSAEVTGGLSHASSGPCHRLSSVEPDYPTG